MRLKERGKNRLRMRKGGSKQKGNSWEWVVARTLGKWWYKDDSSMVRMPTSGALATIYEAQYDVLAGDILQIKHLDDPFPFTVECKFHKEFVLDHLIFERKTSKLFKFWCKIKKEAEKADNMPMLVFKSNFKEPYVVIPNVLTCKTIGELEHPVPLEDLDEAWHYCICKDFIVLSLNNLVQDPFWSDTIKKVRDIYITFSEEENEEDTNDDVDLSNAS